MFSLYCYSYLSIPLYKEAYCSYFFIMTHSVHCNFSCILQIDTIHNSPEDRAFSCNATIQGSPVVTIDGLQYRETMPVVVTYYNLFKETFLEGAMIICIGTLSIVEEDSADPSLAVRSNCLTRFETSFYVPSPNVIC
jgi:hypothetical protein